MKQNIGFIGLGIMGRPMASNLLNGGHKLHLYSRSGVPHDLIEQRGIVSHSIKEVASQSDVIFIMVSDTPDVEQVIFGPNGLIEGLSPGKLLIDMSSICPIKTKAFAKKVEEIGCHYLDAPVSGGEVGAKSGTLSIMVGGDEAVFHKAKPLLKLLGKNITLVGDVGSGQIAKVTNQIIVALTIEAIAEALVFAAKSGADAEKVRQALMGGFASSKILEIHGERMIKGTFTPGFRIDLHQKDLNLALSSAKALNIALPNTATTQELFNACVANYGSQLDHSAIIKSLELLANFSLNSQTE